jgi:hypothetical protein
MRHVEAGGVGHALVVVGEVVAAAVRVEDEPTDHRTLHAVADLVGDAASVGLPVTVLALRARNHLRTAALTRHQVAIAVAIAIAIAIAITIAWFAVAIAIAIAVAIAVAIACVAIAIPIPCVAIAVPVPIPGVAIAVPIPIPCVAIAVPIPCVTVAVAITVAIARLRPTARVGNWLVRATWQQSERQHDQTHGKNFIAHDADRSSIGVCDTAPE